MLDKSKPNPHKTSPHVRLSALWWRESPGVPVSVAPVYFLQSESSPESSPSSATASNSHHHARLRHIHPQRIVTCAKTDAGVGRREPSHPEANLMAVKEIEHTPEAGRTVQYDEVEYINYFARQQGCQIIIKRPGASPFPKL